MLETKVIYIDEENYDESELDVPAKLLSENEVVAFPTETVYGLGGNALSDEAIKKIFIAKGRPSDNPLIVHISDVEQIVDLVDESALTDDVKLLMDEFWPGALTIILKKSKDVPDSVTAGLGTVAIRMPSHKVARELIRKSKKPIAAPSANLSGKPSPTCGEHVVEDLSGRVSCIVCGSSTQIGLESTVIDMTSTPPLILRPGGVTITQIRKVLPEVQYDEALNMKLDESSKPKSPGMKYKHYSPDAEVIIIDGNTEDMISAIKRIYKEEKVKGLKVGIMTVDEHLDFYDFENVKSLGSKENYETVANKLFYVLREFDKLEVDIVLSESFYGDDMGGAVMNRLIKAAGYNIIKV